MRSSFLPQPLEIYYAPPAHLAHTWLGTAVDHTQGFPHVKPEARFSGMSEKD